MSLPENPRPPFRDKFISAIVDRSPFFKPDFLKLFGSPGLIADFYSPIFDKQVERGRLSPDKAATYRQAIIDGKEGGINLFVQDASVGAFTHWGLEKALAPPLVYYMAKRESPEWLIGLALAYVLTTNLTAIPYFAYRAIQEHRYLKERLECDGIEDADKSKRIRSSVLRFSGIVALNALPPPGSSLPGILMTQERNKGLSNTVLRYYVDNFRDLIGRFRNKPES